MERLWTPQKTRHRNPYEQRSDAGIHESPQVRPHHPKSPTCVQEAPAKLAVREPSGPVQSTILRCTLRCARAL
eukprot:6615553-Pyramimonas_sp.AAC.1